MCTPLNLVECHSILKRVFNNELDVSQLFFEFCIYAWKETQSLCSFIETVADNPNTLLLASPHHTLRTRYNYYKLHKGIKQVLNTHRARQELGETRSKVFEWIINFKWEICVDLITGPDD